MELWVIGAPCPRCGRIIQADDLGCTPIVHLPEECLQLLRIDRDRYRDEMQEWKIEVARLSAENARLREALTPIPTGTGYPKPEHGAEILVWYQGYTWVQATYYADEPGQLECRTHWLPMPPAPQDA